jgi:hypothetical protein
LSKSHLTCNNINSVGGRDVPDIVEESEKERIEALEAQLAKQTNGKTKVRV